MKKNSIIILFAAAALCACGPLGKYKAVTTVPTNLYGEKVDTASASIARLSWQDFFRDEKLRSLISRALENNIDLKIAQEHIAQAQASLTGARLEYLPSLSLDPTGNGSYSKASSPVYSYNIAASASWEIDIIGRTATNIASAKASVAQMEDYALAVRSQVVSSVANTYYTLLMLDDQLRVSREMEKVWEKSVQTILEIKEEGFADEVAVNQYQSTLSGIKVKIATLQDQISQSENAMALLLGTPSAKISRSTLDLQELPSQISAGVPVEMLSRRPDVRASQREIEVAFYATKSAWLNFFPTLSISGTGGLTDLVSGAIVPMTSLASLTAGIVQPIFTRGANRKALKIAQSKQREACLDFDKTLYKAGIEVSDAFEGYKAALEKSKYYETQVRCLTQARSDTELIMNNSEDKTYLDVLMAHNSLIDAEFSLIANKAQCLQCEVALYSALGGGTE